jgi:TolC family type I secretion outer membrane protein
MRRFVRVAAISAVLIWSLPARAEIENFEQALAVAYMQNDTLQTDRIGLEALRTELGIARAGFLPTLVAEGTVQQTEIDLVNTGYSGGLRLTQPLFRGGRTFAAMRAARANIRAGEASLEGIEIDVLSTIAEIYADLLLARELVALSQKLEAGLTEQLTAERRRLRLGERTRADVSQAEARLALTQSQLARDHANLIASEKLFARFVGEPAAKTLAPMTMPGGIPPTIDTALEIARRENPLIKRSRHGADFAKAEVAIRRSALLPTVSLEGRLQYRDQIFEFTGVEVEQTLGTIGATVQVPLFQGGAAHAQLSRARKIRKLRELEILEAQRDVEADVVAAWENLRATKIALTSNRQAVLASADALDSVRTEARYGTRSTIEVLDAETDLAGAERAAAQTERDVRVAAILLLAAMGSFTAGDLGLEGQTVTYAGR